MSPSDAGKDKKCVVVGGGLVGCMSSLLLARDGYSVDVFEMREDYRPPKIQEGGADNATSRSTAGGKNSDLHGQLTNTTKRSINLALSHRGLCALREVGLEEQVLRNAVPMEGRMIHPAGETDYNKTVFQPYEHKPGHAIYSISREELNTVLLDELDKMGNVKISFGSKFDGINKETGNPKFKAPADKSSREIPTESSREIPTESSREIPTESSREIPTESSREIPTEFVVGADGAFSKVREELGRLVRLDFSRSYIKHGYKELSIPALPGGKYMMKPHALHIWPRHEFMMIGLPNLDGTFTCTLFMPFADFERLTTPEEVTAFFQEQFPDIAANNYELMPTLLDDYFKNPTSSLLSISCDPWHHKDSLVCLGDSTHATVPFYGQGMNAGFEDALRLKEILDECGHDNRHEAFQEFSKEMVPSRIGLCQVSLDNYVEMRSKTASPLFTLKRNVDWILSDVSDTLPSLFSWIPLYTMVTFTRIPYHKAIQKAKSQDRVLACALAGSVSAALAAALFAARRFLSRA